MVRRLQPSTPAATAPAPATAILEPPALNPQSSTTAVAPANHPTFAMTPELAKAFALSGSTQTQPELVEGVGTPYVTFFEKKADNSTSIAQAIPSVSAGDPVLVVAGTYELVKATPFVILDEFQFWVELNESTFKPVAWRLDQPAGKGDWKEQVVCLMLLLTEQPILTLTTLRTTKCPIAKAVRKAVAQAQTPEAIKGDTILGAMVQANFPPRYRVTGSFVMTPKSGKFPYVLGDARCATTKPEQGVAIMNWFASPEGQDEHKLLRAAFDEQVADVRKKAAAKR